MREQMVLDEKIIGVELTASKKQFKWPVNETERKAKDEDDDESSDEMSSLQTIFVVHSVCMKTLRIRNCPFLLKGNYV